MKHLTTYKIFESHDTVKSIIDDIMDMSLDIQDEGFIVEKDYWSSYQTGLRSPQTYVNGELVAIRLPGTGYRNSNPTPFQLSRIKDFLFRVYEYSKTIENEITFAVPKRSDSNQRTKLNIYDKMFATVDDDNQMSRYFTFEVMYVEIRVRPYSHLT